MTTRGRVFLVDDHVSFADGVASVLSGVGHDIVATASDERSALDIIDRIDFDLAIVDIALADSSAGGIAIARQIRATKPAAKLIFLSMYVSPGAGPLKRALELQPEALLGKEVAASVLIDVVNHVLNGGTYVAGEVGGSSPPTIAELTPTERMVLAELAKRPDSRARLAGRLGISTSTLDTHLTRIKLKVLDDLRRNMADAPHDGHVSTERLIGWARDRGYHIW